MMFSPRILSEDGCQVHSVFTLLREIIVKLGYCYKGNLSSVFPGLKRDSFSSISEPVAIPNQLLPNSDLWFLFKSKYEKGASTVIFKTAEEVPELQPDVKIDLDMIMLAFYIELTWKLSPDYSALVTPLQNTVLATIKYGDMFGVETHHTLDANIVNAILLSKHFVTKDPTHTLICVATSHSFWSAIRDRGIPIPEGTVRLCKFGDATYFVFSLQEFMEKYFAPLFFSLQEDLNISHDKVL